MQPSLKPKSHYPENRQPPYKNQNLHIQSQSRIHAPPRPNPPNPNPKMHLKKSRPSDPSPENVSSPLLNHRPATPASKPLVPQQTSPPPLSAHHTLSSKSINAMKSAFSKRRFGIVGTPTLRRSWRRRCRVCSRDGMRGQPRIVRRGYYNGENGRRGKRLNRANVRII